MELHNQSKETHEIVAVIVRSVLSRPSRRRHRFPIDGINNLRILKTGRSGAGHAAGTSVQCIWATATPQKMHGGNAVGIDATGNGLGANPLPGVDANARQFAETLQETCSERKGHWKANSARHCGFKDSEVEPAITTGQVTHTLYPDGLNLTGGPDKVVPALLEGKNGIAVADHHSDPRCAGELKNLLPTLKKSGVDTFFVEMVKAKDQPVLNEFMTNYGDAKKKYDEAALKGDNNGVAAAEADMGAAKTKLQNYFGASGWSRPGEPEALTDLMAGACDNGMKLVAIDASGTDSNLIAGRLRATNPAWQQQITDTMGNPPMGKYVVFAGEMHFSSLKA